MWNSSTAVRGDNAQIFSKTGEFWGGGLIADFVTYLQASGLAAGTVRLRATHLGAFARQYDLASATSDDVLAWVATPGWMPNTRASNRSSLRSFYQWMVKVGHRRDDPTENLRPIRVPEVMQPVAEHDALEDALARANPQDRLALMLAAYAGLRRAEIAGLHARDLLPNHLMITGKGGKQRKVPIHPRLQAELQPARERGGYLFPGRWGEAVTADNMGRRLARLLQGDLTAHSLRRYFGTNVYGNTMDIRATQILLGHSSLATTQKYVKVTDDSLAAAVATLSA